MTHTPVPSPACSFLPAFPAAGPSPPPTSSDLGLDKPLLTCPHFHPSVLPLAPRPLLETLPTCPAPCSPGPGSGLWGHRLPSVPWLLSAFAARLLTTEQPCAPALPSPRTRLLTERATGPGAKGKGGVGVRGTTGRRDHPRVSDAEAEGLLPVQPGVTQGPSSLVTPLAEGAAG